MNQEDIIQKIKGGLIVSCQALEDEPLHSSFIMSKMAYAAFLGGACGIRANTVVDIQAIKKEVNLPIIGIIKKNYGDCPVYITPTMDEVDELVKANVEIIAIDATKRPRPNGETIAEFFAKVRSKYKNQLFMADISTIEEGISADKLSFDFIGTTLAGYTEYTKGTTVPDIALLKQLKEKTNAMIVAEGGIWAPQDLKKCYECGIHTAVVGSSITRPMLITKRFVEAL